MYTITHEDMNYEIRAAEDLKDVPTAALVATYSELTGKNTSKFASRAKGEEQVMKAIAEVDVAPEEDIKIPTTTGRKSTLNRRAKISINSDNVAAAGEKYETPSNPKRPGTQAAANWDKYRDGMTVDALHKQGVSLADIRWNLEKEFIALEDPADEGA